MNSLFFICECPTCHGEGGFNVGEGDEYKGQKCPSCDGSGEFRKTILEMELHEFLVNELAKGNNDLKSLLELP